MQDDLSHFAIDTLSYAAVQPLSACIDHLSAKGCAAVQLSLHPGYLWPSETDGAARAALRRHLAARGIAVVSVNLPGVEINLASVYPEMRAYTIDLLRQNLELAADLGAPLIVIAPGKPHPLLPAAKDVQLAHFHAALDILLPLASRLGTSLSVENTPSSFLPDAASLIAALDAYREEKIGICYDFPNAHFIREDIGAALAGLGPRLSLVHLADTGHDAHRHAAIGRGTIPFSEIAPVLRGTGFAGLPVLEVISGDIAREMEISAQRLVQLGWGDRRAA